MVDRAHEIKRALRVLKLNPPGDLFPRGALETGVACRPWMGITGILIAVIKL